MAAYTIFVYIVLFLAIYFTLVFLMMLVSQRNKIYDFPETVEGEALPKVSFVVPAYNEEKKIAKSIESLKSVDYPKELMEIIIVNDGSTDKTAEAVRQYHDMPNLVFIDNKDNKGKAARLNQGISRAGGEYIACMDADSMVSPYIIRKTIPYFKDPKVGAVTVTVKVDNPKSFLEKMIEIEYIIGLSLWLKVLSFFNSIHVTPGPFSIYRTSMLTEIGGFDVNNITEDMEIAHRIQRYKYRIACCIATHVKTIIPRNLRGLYRQRKRWYSGALITFWKYKDMVLKKNSGVFGVFLPYIYLLVFLGLALFLTSSYMSIADFVQSTSLYTHTNFNFLQQFSLKDIDPLSISVFSVFGLSSILFVFILAYTGLKIAGYSTK